jgi:hypothetical protein
VTALRTLSGEPSTPDHGHVGWPIDPADLLDRQARGLPGYHPTDPTTINQAPYREFAAQRGPNSL